MSSINLPIPKGWTSVAAGDEFQFFIPIKPGDTLICREKMIGAYEKQSHSGTLIFVIREKTFTNQNDQIVLIRKLSSVCIERLNRGTTSREESPTKYVKSKTELPELIVGPVNIRHLAMFAVATAEFVDIHYDQAYARSLGLPDVIIQGLYKTTIIAQLLKNWTGNGNAIRWLSIQHRGMDVAGNTLKAGGRVIETSRQKDGKLTKCEVWIDNQHGQRTSIGTAGLIILNENV